MNEISYLLIKLCDSYPFSLIGSCVTSLSSWVNHFGVILGQDTVIIRSHVHAHGPEGILNAPLLI